MSINLTLFKLQFLKELLNVAPEAIIIASKTAFSKLHPSNREFLNKTWEFPLPLSKRAPVKKTIF